MYDFPLTGAQKSHLRGLGQKLDATLKVGKSGLTPAFFTELSKLLRAKELVKLRFLGAERDERDVLVAQIADEGRCVYVGGALLPSTSGSDRAHGSAAVRQTDGGRLGEPSLTLRIIALCW